MPFWQREHQLNVGTSYKHRGAQRKQNSIATYLKLSGRRKKTSPRRRSHFRQMIFRGPSIWNDEQSQFIALNFDNCTVFNLFGYVNSHFDNTNSIFRFVILKFCLSVHEDKKGGGCKKLSSNGKKGWKSKLSRNTCKYWHFNVFVFFTVRLFLLSFLFNSKRYPMFANLRKFYKSKSPVKFK